MLPGISDNDQVYLFCLGYDCNSKMYLGQKTIDEMSEYLAMERVEVSTT